MKRLQRLALVASAGLFLPVGCNKATPPAVDPDDGDPVAKTVESCMACHNGASENDYSGTGITDPHPFGGTVASILCTTCHGGDPEGAGHIGSHVPPPPEIGDKTKQQNDAQAYFNRLTLTGIDKLPDYTDAQGREWTALDYLQFVNPGDLRVVSVGRGCGIDGCHGGEHAEWVNRSIIATQTGFFSGTLYSVGVANAIPEHRGLYLDTAADYGFRAVADPSFADEQDPADIGRVGKLLEFPEKAVWGDVTGVYQNPGYVAAELDNDVRDTANGVYGANQVIDGTNLATLVSEQIAITCGDCHLGSAGANNRFADFRSSGCTACHMEYSLDGRSSSTDPNVPKNEPANPDAIIAPERPHVDRHQIRSVFRSLPDDTTIGGITDNACVGCHQGSNRTVLQFWGIRLDQNQDLVNGTQYPDNPVFFQTSANETRLFDPAVGNQTFNGRNANQLISFEDYDDDGLDDTPPDIHHERGMGCIDCHGSRDLHGGTQGDDTSGRIYSRQDQTVAIQCESCHGDTAGYAATISCTDDTGKDAECAVDRLGNPLGNVTVDANGDYMLRGRLDGLKHYVPQTMDTIVQNGKKHPTTLQLIYSPAASHAMGRVDGNLDTGIGPILGTNQVTTGFSHTDSLDCASCHSSWSNNCIGCHLETEYDDNPQNFWFSNITGQRIALREGAADFTYISPIPFTLGVGPRGKITQTQPGIKMFYRYQDLEGNESKVFAFTDRNGNGNNPDFEGRSDFGALTHNKIMAHSIRGRVDGKNEGPRYCVACHLTTGALEQFGNDYEQFRNAMANNDFGNLNFLLLQEHLGRNPGNQLNSPLWVHMVAGLGSGLFLFDENGCPVNPLDPRDDRQYCADGAPAKNFNADNVVYNLDRVVEANGRSNASNSHPLHSGQSSPHRDGALYPKLSGPLGQGLSDRLSNPDPNQGIVLDGWYDADGQLQGAAAATLQP